LSPASAKINRREKAFKKLDWSIILTGGMPRKSNGIGNDVRFSVESKPKFRGRRGFSMTKNRVFGFVPVLFLTAATLARESAESQGR
jgi:hypothetical protein